MTHSVFQPLAARHHHRGNAGGLHGKAGAEVLVGLGLRLDAFPYRLGQDLSRGLLGLGRVLENTWRRLENAWF